MSKSEKKFRKDLQNEGKETAYLDVDRMINEGLSGGSVHMREGLTNIEPSIELPQEAPPNQN